MTAQGDHIVLKCSGSECGMRYPSPASDPRRDACPLCESPVHQVDQFAAPPTAPTLHTTTHAGEIVGVLDNIRSAQNVGTMMRSADGVVLDHLYLGGLTARGDNPKVIKTALGAEQTVPHTSVFDVLPTVEHLHDDGFELWAMDYSDRSEPLQHIAQRPPRVAVIVGNELAGVDPALLALADKHIHLDMYGSKTTLNVGVAFGIAAYWLRALPVIQGSGTQAPDI